MGNRHECENYRGIHLLNSAHKMYAKLITKRINILNEALLIEEQCGFRRGRSCSDWVFILQQLMQKRRELNLSTYFYS
jgi:Reverse transcriptase (RNA-dependent DNA polymerase).